MTRVLAAAGWILLTAAVADWYALRAGVVAHSPAVLAALVAAALVAFVARLAALARRLVAERRGRFARCAEAVLLCGVLVSLTAGMANWLLSLQGSVVLVEGESVRLHAGEQLLAFDAGPLARLDEMGLHAGLLAVELAPDGSAGFYPVSRLRVWREEGEPVALDVSPRAAASFRSLVFHQGAFGFAPRIVILQGDRTVFDRVVPFTSERRGRSGIIFEGRFTIEREQIAAAGSVDLASLDEGMRGHATLVLALTLDGEPLGRGTLLPGHFADLGQGYRVGFAGLEQWSEVVISRRNYGGIVLAGAGLAVAGALLWPVARWWQR
jgi:hypothetical protein